MNTILVHASLPVIADEVVAGDIVVMWVDSWMEEQPEIPLAADKLIQFNRDVPNGSAYHLGDTNVNLNIRIRNNDAADDIYVDRCTLLSNNGLFTPNLDSDDGNTIPALGTFMFQFTIDIYNSGDVNFLYQDALRLRLEDMEQPFGTNIPDENFDFDIYVSSIFDPDDGDNETDLHESLPDIYETDIHPDFEAGENVQEGKIQLTNHAVFSISEVEAYIDSYSIGNYLDVNDHRAVNPGLISADGGNLELFWNFDVIPETPSGYYILNLELQYRRGGTGDTVVEDFRSSGLYVAPSTKVTGPVGGPTNTADINITYTMTGTPPDVDIYYTKNTSEPYDWVFIGSDLTPDGFFKIILSKDGSYSWLAVSENESVPNSSTASEAYYYIYDSTPPDLTSIFPLHASVNVTTNQDILLSFSESINTTSFTFTLEPYEYIWWSNWEDGNTNYSFRPLSFDSGLRYWINITAAADLAGNNLSYLPYSFYINIVNSSAIASGPIEDLTNDEWVTIRYSSTNNPQFVDLYYSTNTSAPYTWTFIGWDNSVDGHYNWLVPMDGSYGWYAVSPNEAAPTNSSPPQASYYVYDGTAPQVIHSIPVNNADDFHVNDEVRITFSEPMASWSVEGSVRVSPFHGMVFRWDNNTLIIDFRGDLDPGREYTITIGTEARDEVGNHLDEPFVLTFTPEKEPIDSAIFLWTIIIEIIAVVIIVLLLLMRKRKRREVPKGPADPEINVKEEVIQGGPENEPYGSDDGNFG